MFLETNSAQSCYDITPLMTSFRRTHVWNPKDQRKGEVFNEMTRMLCGPRGGKGDAATCASNGTYAVHMAKKHLIESFAAVGLQVRLGNVSGRARVQRVAVTATAARRMPCAYSSNSTLSPCEPTT